MKSSFWTPYLSDHTIHAICWTLIHSLWIGLAIALLAGLVITITRKSSAALRYNLLCGTLVLFTLSVWITFWIEIQTSAIKEGAFRIGQVINAPDNHLMIIPVTTAPHLSLFSRMVWLLNEYSNIIFLAWLLFFMLKSLKMAGGLLYIQRIRNYKVHEVSEEFKEKIKVFAHQIGIKQAVRLLQSELVKVPVAVGWLKPVILLPMGIILQLTPEQLDSILWHELAHVRRRDYLVNILQGLVETVFFFNPGLLWLSSLIRAEREACCDDLVLSRMNRKANYLEALLAFGSEDSSRMPLAMSIGSGNQLRDRLKRMIDKENKRLNMAEKVTLIAGLVVLSAFTGLPKTTHQAVKSLISVISRKKDTTAKPKQEMLKQAFKSKQASSAETAGNIEDTTKKADTSVRFTGISFKESDADPANSEINAKDSKGNEYHMIVADGKIIAMEINDVKVNDNELGNYQYMVGDIKRTIAEKRRMLQERMAEFKSKPPFAKFKLRQGNDTLPLKLYNERLKFFNEDKAGLWKKPGQKYLKSEVLLKKMQSDSASYAAEQQRASNVIADLVADKVVAKVSDVKWFGLSNTELIVNGKKQPDEMQQRYKAKYGINEDNGLYYGQVEMTGRGVFVDATTPGGRVISPKVQLFRDMKTGFKGEQPKFPDQQLNIQQFKQKQLFSSDQKWKMQQHDMLAFKPPFSESRIPLQDIVADIADDLVKNNIVKDKDDLRSFNLTNSTLMVNGKAQSGEAHQKLKDKYLKEGQYPFDQQATENPNFGLHYNTKTGSMGIGISNDPGEQ